MQTSLPTQIADQLPDFRNLGVVMRMAIVVNLLLLVMDIAAVDSVAAAWQRFFSRAWLLEPILLLVLATLAGVAPMLSRLPYREGVALTVMIVVALTTLFQTTVSRVVDPDNVGVWRPLMFALGASWLLLGYFRLRGRALSPLLSEARLQALQARIRPHFLFNSLNAVLSLIRSEPRKAESALEDLADLFRVFMAENLELSTLEKEINLAKQYLSIESLRLGERLTLNWHTENMPSGTLIPPLVIQPLLENAVYHGIEPSSKPGEITINIFRVRDEVHIDIRNPYVRDSGGHHAGNKMAMGNIRERLFLHFDAEASLKTSVGSDYYQVHLIIPYRTTQGSRHERTHKTIAGR